MGVDGGLRPIFRDKLRVGFDWTSVETGGTGRGVPDSNYCAKVEMTAGMALDPVLDVSATVVKGVEGWIEFKQTSGWACTLRPEQVGWLVRRSMHGGRVFVATRRYHDGHSRAEATDELWLHSGQWARELKSEGLRAVDPLGVWHGGPSGWDWDEIRRLLCS